MEITISRTEGAHLNSCENKSKSFIIPFRYFVLFMSFITTTISFGARNNINVAILAMTRQDQFTEEILRPLNSTRELLTFQWDQREQGVIVGAYFYTYASAQIVTGWVSDKFDTVTLMVLSQIVASICCIISPLAVKIHFAWLVFVRMLIGLAHGFLFPTLFIIAEQWFTPQELSLAQSLFSVGANFGNIVILPITAWLCEQSFAGGWPAAFYVMGFINMILAIVWIFTMTSGPAENPFVSKKEKAFLARVAKSAPKHEIKVQWLKIITSTALWAVTLARGFSGMAYYMVSSKMPTYVESVLKFKLQKNGFINSLFFLSVCISQMICGPLSQKLIIKGYLSPTVIRKIFESIALLGPAICLSIITVLESSTAIVVTVGLAMFFLGATTGGDVPIIPEMAPHLIGTAFGFANTLACISGFISPLFIGFILEDSAESASRWNLSFKVIAGLQFFGFLMFASFATSERQEWGVFSPDLPMKQPSPDDFKSEKDSKRTQKTLAKSIEN